jgi:hypothetical protein
MRPAPSHEPAGAPDVGGRPNPTAKEGEVFEHLERLKKQVGLEGLDVVPYRTDEVAGPRAREASVAPDPLGEHQVGRAQDVVHSTGRPLTLGPCQVATRCAAART